MLNSLVLAGSSHGSTTRGGVRVGVDPQSVVETLCMTRAQGVNQRWKTRFFLPEPRVSSPATGPVWSGFRAFLRLIDASGRRQDPCLSAVHKITVFAPDRPMSAQRYERAINDRRYVVEATLVDPDRWRAYLVGVPGGPTALMPFYGETPEQAVERLADWLALAHRSAALTP